MLGTARLLSDCERLLAGYHMGTVWFRIRTHQSVARPALRSISIFNNRPNAHAAAAGCSDRVPALSGRPARGISVSFHGPLSLSRLLAGFQAFGSGPWPPDRQLPRPRRRSPSAPAAARRQQMRLQRAHPNRRRHREPRQPAHRRRKARAAQLKAAEGIAGGRLADESAPTQEKRVQMDLEL